MQRTKVPPVERRALRSSTVLIIVLAAGVTLRAVSYFGAGSLWIDEARVALNIAARSYLHLLPPLDHDQSAPLLFLWAGRLSVDLFGVSELALRLVPMVAGLAALALIHPVASRLLGRTGAVFVTALAAFSPGLVAFSNEVKQYAVEVAVTLLLLLLAFRWIEAPQSGRRTASLLGAGVLSVWCASSAIFVLVGLGLAMASVPASRYASARVLAGAGVAWSISFGGAYALVYRAAAENAYMRRYWTPAFLVPWEEGFLGRSWTAVRTTLWGMMVGREAVTQDHAAVAILMHGLTLLLLGATALGAAHLVRRRGIPAASLVLAPIVALLTAAAAGLYPLSLRTAFFAAPLLWATFGAGLEHLSERTRQRGAWWLSGAALLVVSLGLAIEYASGAHPREHLRPLIAELRQHRRPQEPVYVFAGSIPAWAFYTTDWTNPDRDRLRWLNAVSAPGGPAFQNAASRSRVVQDEGAGLSRDSPRGPEILGVPSGIESLGVVGPTMRDPDTGWADHEARRIRPSSSGSAWVVMSHFFGPELSLLDELERAGARRSHLRLEENAILVRYEFPPRVSEGS